MNKKSFQFMVKIQEIFLFLKSIFLLLWLTFLSMHIAVHPSLTTILFYKGAREEIAIYR